MFMIGSLATRLREENGGVLVFVAVGLPVLLSVFAIALDVGNWFLHKRAIQNQVDAAAWAGGSYFSECFAKSPADAFAAMKAEAYHYDGKNGLPQYNPQIGGTLKGTLTVLYNSQNYATGETDPVFTPANPCDAPDYAFDVKATDADIPLILAGFLPGLSNLSHIHARARVQLKKEQISAASLPLAVPNVNPKTVTATFVNQTTGGALAGCSGGCVFQLAKGAPSGALNMWSGTATIPAASAGTKIGVRIGLATAGQGCPSGTDGGTGFVCYDNANSSKGLAVLRVTDSTAGTHAAPTLNGVWPTTLCSGSPFFSDVSLGGGATCGAGVQAVIDFGTGAVDPTLPASSGGVGAAVVAKVNGTTAQMTYGGGVWSTIGGAFGLPTDLGPIDVSMQWEEHSGTVAGKDCTKTPLPGACKGDWGSSVQVFHSAYDVTSGPVKTLALSESGASNPGAPYSLAAGSTHTVTVTLGLEGSLQLSPQTRLLRLTGGSRTSAIQCDGSGASAFRDSVAYGCKTKYQLNASGLCPDPAPPTGPPDCIPLETGTMTGPTSQGLNIRFAACPANNWPDYDPATDPRIVQLMVTDFSYLGGSGGTQVPVVDFGAFYITGWEGSTCANNQPWPFAPLVVRNGDIWGHFIKFVPDKSTIAGQVPCDLTSITPCVPTLTK
jgi:hypothetical protein